MTTTVLGNALAFAKRDHAVLPLHWPVKENGRFACSCRNLRQGCSPAKHPFGRLAPRGLLSATTEIGVVKYWFGYSARDANYAVRTDGALVVMDVDPRNGGDETLRALEREHGALPHTWRVITGSGGEHIFFDATGLHLRRGKADDIGLGDGVDIPSYVVGAGSRHICGRLYAWNVDFHPAKTPLARPPQWLVEHLSEPQQTQAAGHDPATWAAGRTGVFTEYRDLEITKVAEKLLRAVSLDPAFIKTLLLDWNAAHCSPPLPEDEVIRIYKRFAKREVARLEDNDA
jgi:hypothetical protein